MSKFGMIGKFITHEGERDALAQILLEAANILQSVEGCELYVVSVSDNEPESVGVTEVWSDSAAHQASLTIEEVRALIQRGRPMIASVEGTKLRTLGGKGL
ncbi:MAG: antibiotic biosynthesis monooxygenase [Bacilli bacterium]